MFHPFSSTRLKLSLNHYSCYIPLIYNSRTENPHHCGIDIFSRISVFSCVMGLELKYHIVWDGYVFHTMRFVVGRYLEQFISFNRYVCSSIHIHMINHLGMCINNKGCRYNAVVYTYTITPMVNRGERQNGLLLSGYCRQLFSGVLLVPA